MNVKSVEKENGNAKIAIEIEKAEFEVASLTHPVSKSRVVTCMRSIRNSGKVDSESS